MNSPDTRVALLPLGEVPNLFLRVISANIAVHFGLPAAILPPEPLPDQAFDRQRSQYDAGILIHLLEAAGPGPGQKTLGILAQDLFVPIFSHVFGEARQGGNVAVVSLFRLARRPDRTTAPHDLFVERAAKVALHELGHLVNLFHCDEPNCLMHFSGDIDALDAAPFYLCRRCAALLHPLRS